MNSTRRRKLIQSLTAALAELRAEEDLEAALAKAPPYPPEYGGGNRPTWTQSFEHVRPLWQMSESDELIGKLGLITYEPTSNWLAWPSGAVAVYRRDADRTTWVIRVPGSLRKTGIATRIEALRMLADHVLGEVDPSDGARRLAPEVKRGT